MLPIRYSRAVQGAPPDAWLDQLALFANDVAAPHAEPATGAAPDVAPAVALESPALHSAPSVAEPSSGARLVALRPAEISAHAVGVHRTADDAFLASVRTYGVLHPVLVRRANDSEQSDAQDAYELLAGGRRLDAVRQLAAEAPRAEPDAAHGRVPAIICDADDLHAALVPVLDDALHAPLCAWDRAAALERVRLALTATYGREPTTRELAAVVSQAIGTVSELRAIATTCAVPGALADAGLLTPDGQLDVERLRRLTHGQLLVLSRRARGENGATSPPTHAVRDAYEISGPTTNTQRAARFDAPELGGAVAMSVAVALSVDDHTSPSPASAVSTSAPASTAHRRSASAGRTPSRGRRAAASCTNLAATAADSFALRLTRPLDSYPPTDASAYAARLVEAALLLVRLTEPGAVQVYELPDGDSVYLVRLPPGSEPPEGARAPWAVG